MFDLERAIASWRRNYETHRAFTAEDLRELEAHLRDEIEGFQCEGYSEEWAFWQAVQEVGDFGTLEAEYRKVHWEKLWYRRGVGHELIWMGTMLRNYARVALRNLARHKGYAFINVTGLAIGIACFLLILLYVQDERSYDQFYANAEQVYRVSYSADQGNGIVAWAYSGSQWGPTLVETFPEIIDVARLEGNLGDVENVVVYEDQTFRERRVYWADASVFSVFGFPLVRGDAQTALEAPGTVVLSESTARKYFGPEDPLGQVVVIDEDEYRVTGVFEDLPSNTHIPFKVLASLSTILQDNPDRNTIWQYTYALLDDAASAETLAEKMPAFIDAHVERGGFLAGLASIDLQPITEIHLRSHRQGEPTPGGDSTMLYIFAAIAVLVLVIACINFMNLATARALRRAKEVGMRKVLGAQRRQLVAQFLGEAILLCGLGVLPALLLSILTLPLFNELAGKAMTAAVLLQPVVLIGLLGVIVVVGAVAGTYPALFLSSFEPMTALRTYAKGGTRKARLRQGLVVGQFTISIALLIGTGIVYTQLEFVRTKQLGFAKEQLITIPVSDSLAGSGGQYAALRERLLEHARIVEVAGSTNRLGERIWIWSYRPEGWQGEQEYWTTPALLVDYDYLRTYGMKLAAGRDFSRAYGNDPQRAILINESAARFLGWEDPVGRTMQVPGQGQDTPPSEVEVVGVVKDFHFASLHQEVAPLILDLQPNWRRYITIRIEPEDVAETIAYLEETWRTFDPDNPPQYAFADAQFAQLYQADQHLGRVVWVFTSLALLVACLGLFGLASLMVAQRTKEIGVRKVLGASVPGIVGLISQDYIRLVGIAFVVAVPLAYFAARTWLDTFAYRVDISPWIFLLAGLAALGVALLTVSYQAIRTATLDPVKSLRYE